MLQNFQLFSRKSLGGQVMSLLAATLLSTLIIFALSVVYFVNRTESEAWRSRQGEAARNAAGTVGGFVQRVQDSLTIIGAVEPDQLVSDQGELTGLLAQNPALLELIRLDSNGRVIASAYQDKSMLANLITIPQSEWFLQALSGQFFIGSVQLSVLNEPYLIMAVPSPQGGVVAARVRMNVLWDVVQNIHFGLKGSAYVITGEGSIIAHTNPEVVINRTTIDGREELNALLVAPNYEWFGDYTNFENEQVVGVTAPVAGTNWIVVTELPLSEAFAASRTAVLVLGAEAFLLMGLAGWALARSLKILVLAPMEHLRVGAEEIGRGNLSHRIRLIRSDEIGHLASAFDAMADHLQDRETQLAKGATAMQMSEARYRAIVEDQTELICRFLPDKTLTFVNEAYCRYFGKQRKDLIGHSFMPRIPNEDRPFVEAQAASLSSSTPVITYEHRVTLPDGSLRWVRWTDRVLFNSEGQASEYASVGRDITEQKLAQIALQVSETNLRHLNAELEDRVQERTADLLTEITERQRIESALRESEERYALAISGANDGLWDWDLKSNQIYFSPRWKALLGYEENEFGNLPDEWFNRIHPQDQAQMQTSLALHVKGDVPHFESEYRLKHANGSYRWMLSRGQAVRDEKGAAYRLSGSQTDITDRKLAEERLIHDALHDALTGLPNRVLFMDRLSQRLEHAKRRPRDLFAVLFIDLDRFKVVNDSLGHAVGDQLLIVAAHRLKACIRQEDTISRLSGDEFAILLNGIGDISDAMHVAERIQIELNSASMLDSIDRPTSASIGITMFDGSYAQPEELLRDADTAMYRAKAKGGGQYQVFSSEMYTRAVALLQMESSLRHAVEKKELEVYYQPIVSLKKIRILGFEALLRWNHPQRGIVSPLEFIDIAEDTGLIFPIGEYVLQTACAQVKSWRESGHPDLWVSVNISSRQFQDQNLIKVIEKTLAQTGLPGDGLQIEITEGVAMKDLEHSIKFLYGLRRLGVQVSLDDFGNGYSSLSYINRFPLNVLKIDRSFIRDIEINKNSAAIATAIIALAHTLNLDVVAEGVEKEEQLSFLKSKACDKVQGFLFNKPVPAGEIDEILKSKRPYGRVNRQRASRKV